MGQDFELARKHLEVEKWLVFGGSWGSTLSLYYAETYPQACLGLIIQGIFLNTIEELQEAVFNRRPYEKELEMANATEKEEARTEAFHLSPLEKLNYFDRFFDVAAEEVKRQKQDPLDPYDTKRLIEVYQKLIMTPSPHQRRAIWIWHAFETNLMVDEAD